MAFKIMPNDVILKLLESAEDTLTGPLNDLFSKIKDTLCPSCDSPLIPKPDLDVPFSPDSHIPRYLGCCPLCGLVMDVHTSKIHTYPTKRDVPG
jgi:RNase P subunit RPR2